MRRVRATFHLEPQTLDALRDAAAHLAGPPYFKTAGEIVVFLGTCWIRSSDGKRGRPPLPRPVLAPPMPRPSGTRRPNVPRYLS